MAVRVANRCDGCGQVDDHPKHHYANETYHHDCIPYKVVRDMTTTGYWDPDGNWVNGEDVSDEDQTPANRMALMIRDAAQSGVHGDDLVEEIRALHEEGN